MSILGFNNPTASRLHLREKFKKLLGLNFDEIVRLGKLTLGSTSVSVFTKISH